MSFFGDCSCPVYRVDGEKGKGLNKGSLPARAGYEWHGRHPPGEILAEVSRMTEKSVWSRSNDSPVRQIAEAGTEDNGSPSIKAGQDEYRHPPEVGCRRMRREVVRPVETAAVLQAQFIEPEPKRRVADQCGKPRVPVGVGRADVGTGAFGGDAIADEGKRRVDEIQDSQGKEEPREVSLGLMEVAPPSREECCHQGEKERLDGDVPQVIPGNVPRGPLQPRS